MRNITLEEYNRRLIEIMGPLCYDNNGEIAWKQSAAKQTVRDMFALHNEKHPAEHGMSCPSCIDRVYRRMQEDYLDLVFERNAPDAIEPVSEPFKEQGIETPYRLENVVTDKPETTQNDRKKSRRKK
jgi:hypothetical protein